MLCRCSTYVCAVLCPDVQRWSDLSRLSIQNILVYVVSFSFSDPSPTPSLILASQHRSIFFAYFRQIQTKTKHCPASASIDAIPRNNVKATHTCTIRYYYTLSPSLPHRVNLRGIHRLSGIGLDNLGRFSRLSLCLPLPLPLS